jgi:hypothetical protein
VRERGVLVWERGVLVREVVCPACGAIVEGASDAELVGAARAHTLQDHGYDIPAEHVLAAAQDAL